MTTTQNRLKSYNVSHVAFIQATILTILMVVNGIYTGLTSCIGSNKTDCGSNAITIPVELILLIIWVGFLAAMAYAVWVRRTTSLIILFVILEIITAAVSAFGITHSNNALGLATSVIDLLVELWVLAMCYSLFRLRGTSSAPPTGRKRSKLNQHSDK